MTDLADYNKYFESDDENNFPVSSQKRPATQSTVLSETQVFQAIDPNVLNPKQTSPSANTTSRVHRLSKSPRSRYRETTQLPSSICSSAASSNSALLVHSSDTSPGTDIDEDNTQLKRRKFYETMLDSTNHEPAKQMSLDDSLDDIKLNSFFGLPSKVKDLLKHLRGIESLYDWQTELLNEMYEMKPPKKNLLYLSPTSGGKTLVAEILLLQCLLLAKKNVIFVMPFVSIVQEKVEMLVPFGEHLNFYVEEYAGLKGSVPPVKRLKGKNTLFICTIEKANSLMNSLIEAGRLSEVGMVVADELHMIGDGPRGAIYEMILSKAKFCGRKSDLQIVATTATLENKKEIASFLEAHLYERHFRPVELKEYIKLDKQIFLIDKTMINKCDENDYSFVRLDRELTAATQTPEMRSSDPDQLISLITELFEPTAHTLESCLIFCPTKKNCENVAQLLAKFLPSSFKQHKRDLKLRLFNDLREQNANNICPVLRQSLQFGIAYHHSGLTTEERHLIESAYREGVLFLLTCTSTLAAGVNLPAKRVIIRAPYVGRDFICPHQYKQMIGRAGRAGFNTCGESILLFQNMDRLRVYDLVSGPMKRCESSIEFDSKSIRMFVLSLIGLDLAKNGFNVLEVFKETLFYVQKKGASLNEEEVNKDELRKLNVPVEFLMFTHGLRYLLRNGLIRVKGEEETDTKREYGIGELYFGEFEITKLGMAAVKGGIDLEFTGQLHADLKSGLESMVLSNYLHLLYLCTPYELVASLLHIDFDVFARKFGNLSGDEAKCASVIGVSEEFINKKRFQSKINSKTMNESVLRRFYLTLIIYELWKNSKSIWHVSNEFQLDRGFVQQIIQSSASFTSGVLHFCENLDEFWPYKNLLQDLMKRLQYNCSENELLEIMELDSVRLPRAQQLFNAGFTGIELIAKADAKEMSEKIKNMPLPAAQKLVKSAKRVMSMRADGSSEGAEAVELTTKNLDSRTDND